MARQTTNYGYNISEGSDLVNLLTDVFPNFESIDGDLKDVSNSAVGSATELLTGTVHALTRSDSDRDIFVFVATSNFEAGETFTVDGVQVTAKTADGQNLSTGAYVINSSVLCVLNGTLLTVFVNPAKAIDSDKLDGHDSSYYATASDLSALDNSVDTISDKVGTAVLTTTAPDLSGAVNELNTQLSDKMNSDIITSVNVTLTTNGYGNATYTPPSGYVILTISGLPYGRYANWGDGSNIRISVYDQVQLTGLGNASVTATIWLLKTA